MKKATGRLVLVAAAGVVLNACAPLALGPAGWAPGAGAGLGFNFTRCGSPLGHSAEAVRMGVVTTPTMRARAIQSRIQQIQARASLGYTAAGSTESWKRVAAGDC